MVPHVPFRAHRSRRARKISFFADAHAPTASSARWLCDGEIRSVGHQKAGIIVEALRPLLYSPLLLSQAHWLLAIASLFTSVVDGGWERHLSAAADSLRSFLSVQNRHEQ